MQTEVFEGIVSATSFSLGMPHQRHAYVPQPVMGKTNDELWAYINGPDPISGRPVMEEVVEALTRPLSREELEPPDFDRSTPRYVEPDTENNLHKLFVDNAWTDYLPIVLPTEERVCAMLAHTSHKADEVAGKMRPTSTREAWTFTVEKVAVNAVMSGANPEYFPVILALAGSQVSARGSTTSSMASMVVVNGPIRKEIGMNWGMGALGPYNHANATIGRAYGLLSQNLQGGSVPGKTYMGSQGNNYMYNSVTFAENEERSPWAPFHVQRGFRLDESVVSIFRGARTTSYLLGLREKHWKEHVLYLLRGINPYLSPTLILDPITAQQFVDRGNFDTKEKLIDWIYQNATLPAGIYWDYQLIQNYILPRAQNGVEPWATKLKASEEEKIPMFRPEEIHVIVVGGETNGYWRIMGCDRATTVNIDDWR